MLTVTQSDSRQPLWRREWLALLTAGLFGWTLEAWLCWYFWKNDTGIFGGFILLLGPSLVTLAAFVAIHILLLIVSARQDVQGARSIPARSSFRAVGLLAAGVTNLLGLVAWHRWFLSVEQSFDRYVPKSRMPMPLGLNVMPWLLTLLCLAVIVYVLRELWRKVAAKTDVRAGPTK